MGGIRLKFIKRLMFGMMTLLFVYSMNGCVVVEDNVIDPVDDRSENYILYGANIAIFLSSNGYSNFEFNQVYAGLLRHTTANVFITTNGEREIRILDGYGGNEYVPFIHLSDINIDDLTAFIIIGGSGISHDLDINDELLMAFLQEFEKTGKGMGSICGGSALFAKAGLLEGRRVTGVSYMQEVIESYGGIYTNATVEIDGQFVTAKYRAEHIFVEQFIRLLEQQVLKPR